LKDRIVQINLLYPRSKLPTKATEGSAAYDLYAYLHYQYQVYPGETAKISTGVSIHIDNDNVAAHILSRSGLASKGIVVANAPGLIDSDYQGEIFVLLYNRTQIPYKIQPGDRIAQLEFVRIQLVDFEKVEAFTESTVRGSSGFGSSGV